MSSSLADSERRRLESLLSYEILDTPPDQALDDVTQLAAHICDTPVALITFIDSERQWFKSRVGFPFVETAREFSFCAQAIMQPHQLMIVPDAMVDERFNKNPLVTGPPNIRFYCGLPLVTNDGNAIGALCVIDTIPRELTADQLTTLRALHRGVMGKIELRRHAKELERMTNAVVALNAEMEQRVDERTQQYAETLRALQKQVAERERAEAAVHESEVRYRTLWETTTDAVLIVSSDSTIHFANHAVLEIFGYEPIELMGKSLAILQPERMRGGHLRGMARHLATGKKELNWRSTEIIGLHREGHEIPLEIAFSQFVSGEVSMFAGFIRDISSRKHTEREIGIARDRLDIALAASGLSLWEWDVNRGTIYLDGNWGILLGGAAGIPSYVTVEDMVKITHPDDLAATRRLQLECIKGLTSEYVEEHRVKRPSGEWSWMQSRGKVVERDANGNAMRMSGVNIDITERKRSEEGIAMHALQQGIVAEFGQFALTDSNLEELMNEAAHSVTRGLGVEYCKVLQYFPDDRRLLVRAAVGWDLSAMGHTAISLEGDSHAGFCLKRNGTVMVEDFSKENRFALSAFNQGKGIQSGIAVIIHGGGGLYGVLTAHAKRVNKYSDDDVNFVQSIANVLAAAVERWESEQRFAYLAQFDPLTGLPNRNLFRDRLTQAIGRAQREERMTALVFLDLDRFKEINDTFGHAAGDRVLKDIAARLVSCLRESDTIARLGGDEFIVVLEEILDVSQAESAARKILSVFSQPVSLEGTDFYVTPSIGIAIYPADGVDGDTLLKHADIAMYQAKNEGRNNFQFYSSALSSAASDRLTVESSLRKALERNEFVLFYQAVVDLATSRISSAEALLRWRHPEWGLVAPDRFMKVAEQTGLIIPIGEWVMHEACRQLMEWRKAGVPTVEIAVNLSARQFRKTDLISMVSAALSANSINASQLKIEITESLLMENPDESIVMLHKLKAMGMQIALDDFGIGYSSLSYLKQFPIDILKIDQSFVHGVPNNSGDSAMVKAMISLAHSLGLTTTAEGAETEEQIKFLRDHGCDRAQGYFFSRPIPAEEFEKMLRNTD